MHIGRSNFGGNCMINFYCLACVISQISQYYVQIYLNNTAQFFCNSFDIRGGGGVVGREKVLCHSYGGCDAHPFNLQACLMSQWVEMFWGHLEGIRVARLCSFVSPSMPCGNSECSLRCPGERSLPQATGSFSLGTSLLNRGEHSGLVPAILPMRSLRPWRDGTTLQSCNLLH